MNALLAIPLALALVSVVAAQVAQRRGARRKAAADADAGARAMEDASIAQNPRPFVQLHGHRLASKQQGRRAALQQTEDELASARKAEGDLPAPTWTGLARVVRLGTLALVPVLVVAGAILNCEIFVALANGQVGSAPVLKGLGASLVELLLALALAHLVTHREVRSLGWQVRLAAVLVVLASVVCVVAYYAPQRSAQAYGTQLDLDRRTLVAAKDAHQPLAVTAATDQLEADTTRLRRAEDSDAAQAVAFPVIEALVAELAIEGLLVVEETRRRRRAHRQVVQLAHIVNTERAELEAETAAATRVVAERLFGAGRADLNADLGIVDRPVGALPDAGNVTPPVPPAPPRPMPPAAPTQPASPGPLDLDRFAPPPGSGSAWDLGG